MQKYFLFQLYGQVQGVGFRPFFYREAKKKGLKGYIKNTGRGVEILVNQKNAVLEILKNLPPLAKIDKMEIAEKKSEEKFSNFEIRFSDKVCETVGAKIPPDISICDDCVEELLDSENRRYQYFFTNCTNCGPRYSLSEKLPFDREHTALKGFSLCEECEKEYKNQEDRRFHAQTIACATCGPKLSFFENGKKLNTDPLAKTIELLQEGKVVSIKGIGGFFLCCKAEKEIMESLRIKLNRPHKPFAILMKDLEMARKFVRISKKEEVILSSKERPIVLCEKREDLKAKQDILHSCEGRNPFYYLSENNRLGVMLPYTALHHLIFQQLDVPLVMTSANLPNAPIPTRREVQDWQYILDYDREITNFSDDSIIKVLGNQPLIIRRSRGTVPEEIQIPEIFLNEQTKDLEILAVGSEMKNTFCLKQKESLILSPHLGNTFYLENFENFKCTIQKFLKITGSCPEVILCDGNKDFNVSGFARKFAEEKGLKYLEVSHHLAHVFSVAIEHNLQDFIGIAADGTGVGRDGKVWGGEVFRIQNQNEKRIGHLEYQTLVGGDIANKEPVRYLVGILEKFMPLEKIQKLLPQFDSSSISTFYAQKQQGFNVVETSSCGRVLDAVAILLGFGEKNFYEGYLAEKLESMSGEGNEMFFEPILKEEEGLLVLKTTELFEFLAENLEKIPRENLAAFVQLYLAKGLWIIGEAGQNRMDSCLRRNEVDFRVRRNEEKTDSFGKDEGKMESLLPVVFSGGCAYNSIMNKFFVQKKVLYNEKIPSGDGGISAGQIGYFLSRI